ncbi:hypothetical protein QYE76_048186 [Lolium multiflorum]|uniref:RRM domain-containing protein n=1 Tax=Lolium multiflorum TaxID=4521 RepID=A0AAD8PI96_LOLMU|nr:hypothetical protein QYE76_048186 [Lolium multiflorum]
MIFPVIKFFFFQSGCILTGGYTYMTWHHAPATLNFAATSGATGTWLIFSFPLAALLANPAAAPLSSSLALVMPAVPSLTHAMSSMAGSVQPNTSIPPAMSKLHINGRLYLDNMAPCTGDVDLRSYFGHYGDVADIFIPTYRLTGQPRCCAFIQFFSPDDAGRVLTDGPRHVINGQEVYIARARPGHLEESSVYQYKPLCERQVRYGPWRGYRVGDIGKTSFGRLVYDSVIIYISEDGVRFWWRPVEMHTESKSTGYGPRQSLIRAL